VLTLQWRGRHYSFRRSGNGFAAIVSHGGLEMIVKISHYDQQYALLEALEDFIKKCHGQGGYKKRRRAIDAARELHAQLNKTAKTE